MNTNCLLLLLCCCLIVQTPVPVSAEKNQGNVPEGLYEALYKKLKTGDCLIRNLRRRGYDTTIGIDEIDPDIPLQIYHFKGNLEAMADIDIDKPVMELVEPTGFWRFNVMARGKNILEMDFHQTDSGWNWVSTGGGRRGWEEVKENLPDSRGVQPVLIGYGNRPYIHFPHINDWNLTLVVPSDYRQRVRNAPDKYREGEISEKNLIHDNEDAMMVTDSYDSASVIDSRITLKIFKDRYIRDKQEKSTGKGWKVWKE